MFVYTYVLSSGFPTKIVDVCEFVNFPKRAKWPTFSYPINSW